MKLTKKLLLAAAVMMAASFGFMGCGEDDDDENKMLSGSNKDYSIDFLNETGATSRGYKTTTFRHAGALCQMTMSKASANSGAMGYIWDLESNYEKEGSAREAEKDPRRFFIFGFNYEYFNTGKVAYYLSLYKNVTNIYLNNFGATATNQKETGATAASEGATEKEYIALKSGTEFAVDTTADDVVVTVDVYEGGTFKVNKKGERTYSKYDGTFVVDIYNGKVEAADIGTAINNEEKKITTAGNTTTFEATTSVGTVAGLASLVKSIVIPAKDIGYLEDKLAKAGDDTQKQAKVYESNICEQRNGAVYANCYQDKTLTGSWHYADTYNEAEVIEDAE